MAGERYTQEFKIAAVKQITQEGHSIPYVARRLGITTKSLYIWRTRSNKDNLTFEKISRLDDLGFVWKVR